MSSRIFNLLCVKINSSQKISELCQKSFKNSSSVKRNSYVFNTVRFSKSIYLMEFFKKNVFFFGKYSLKYLISRPFRIFIFEGFEIINCLYLVCLSRLKSEFFSSFRGSFLKTHFSRYF